MTKAYGVIAKELREKLCVTFTSHMLGYGSEAQPNEFVLDPKKVADLSKAILQVDVNNLDVLEDVYHFEYELFPDLEFEQSRTAILIKLKEFFKVHPGEVMYYNDDEGNVINSPVTSENIDTVIAFYINKCNEQRVYRNKLLKPLEDRLNSYTRGREVPQQIEDYLRPYTLDGGSTRTVLDTLDIMINSENPKEIDIDAPELFNETIMCLFESIDGGNNDDTEGDIQLMVEYFSMLEEEYVSSELLDESRMSTRFQFTLLTVALRNSIRLNRSLKSIRPSLIKMVNGTRNITDIEILRNDKDQAVQILGNQIKADPPNKKELEDHLKWVKGEYTDLINSKSKEIREKIKNESVMSFILSEDDDYMDDLDDLEDDIRDDAKEYDRAEKEVEKAEDKKNPREVYDSKSKLTNAKRGLVKNSSKLSKLLNKTLSLKSENIDKTLSIQYKALRVAVGALVVGGSLAVGPLLIGKIGTVLVSSLAIGKYNQVRTDRTKGVLESQITYLNDRIDNEMDPKKKKDLNMAKKELQSKLKSINSKIETRNKIKSKVTGKNSSSGDSDSDW